MEKQPESLPTYTDAIAVGHRSRSSWTNRRRKRRTFRLIAAACLTYLAYSAYQIAGNTQKPNSTLSMEQLREDHAVCTTLKQKPAESSAVRDYNKRWVNSTKPLLIRNATVWTGEPAEGTSEEDARAGKGWSWTPSDVFLRHGLIVKVAPNIKVRHLPRNTEIFEAHGRPLTAGIVDMHSHAGLSSVGNLQDDVNEFSSDITPYVRSIDGLDPLQPEFEYIKSGGVTTSLFLPGSGNNIGGEAYVLKFAVGKKNGREEVSQQDLYADPDRNWRYMKMACGENPKRVYGKVGEHGPVSRLGEGWAFRHALEQATKYVKEQDEWCAAADAVGAENMATHLRQELEWEALGAVLRGQVRVNTHCYTIPDLEAFVRHTNEFKFRVYAFHHAHQTFLIPEVLKRAWGGTPAAALFADNMYYKVESYTASERAGAILYAHNITPTYVSDNPVINSQHVVFEAAKAYGNGLPYHAALAGVTSESARLLGLGDRLGKIKAGFDADIVVWDSDPLSVGATPVQVWIDGAEQFKDPVVLEKPAGKPISPDAYLIEEPQMKERGGNVIFRGVSHNYMDGEFGDTDATKDAVVIVRDGKLACVGICTDELAVAQDSSTPVVTLKHGYLTPPLTAFGSALGLIEIDAEVATHDGPPPSDGVARSVDGLLFGGKQLARAFEHGVTRAISANTGKYWNIDAKGVSVGIRTGAKHAREDGAVWQEEVGLHYPFTLRAKGGNTPSTSSLVRELRGKLLDAVNEKADNNPRVPTKEQYEEKTYLKRVVIGKMPLILSVHSADTIASIIRLKSEIEAAIDKSPIEWPGPTKLRLILIGGAESHLVAKELAEAEISVILAPFLPHQQTWDQKRSLTGAPLTNGTTINWLLDAGVLVGISVEEQSDARDLGLLAGIALANSEGRLSFENALGLVGRNFYKMLGIGKDGAANKDEWIVWEGSPLEIGGRVRGIGTGSGKAFVWQ